MNILKRQLALLLVFAMTLTMLPMPAHADEVTELETPPVIVEETAEKPTASNEVASTEAKNKPVENAEPDVAAKENAVPAAETPVNTTVDSDADNTEEIIADVFEDTPASDPVEESEVAIDTDATTKDAEVEENTESDPTVESEEDSSVADSDESENVEPSEADTQETTDQMESETEVPATAAFSLRRSAANAAADCAHENTTFVVDSREDYWYYLHTNEAQHVANYYMGDKCDNCGVMVSQVHNYFAEDHVMNENSVCTLCGYGAESLGIPTILLLILLLMLRSIRWKAISILIALAALSVWVRALLRRNMRNILSILPVNVFCVVISPVRTTVVLT